MVTTRIRPEYLLPTLVGIGVIIAALVNVPWWTLLTVAFIYLVSLPIGIITASRLAAEAEAEAKNDTSTPPPAKDEQMGTVRLIDHDQDDDLPPDRQAGSGNG